MFNSVFKFYSPPINPTFHKYDNKFLKKFNYSAEFYVKNFLSKILIFSINNSISLRIKKC